MNTVFGAGIGVKRPSIAKKPQSQKFAIHSAHIPARKQSIRFAARTEPPRHRPTMADLWSKLGYGPLYGVLFSRRSPLEKALEGRSELGSKFREQVIADVSNLVDAYQERYPHTNFLYLRGFFAEDKIPAIVRGVRSLEEWNVCAKAMERDLNNLGTPRAQRLERLVKAFVDSFREKEPQRWKVYAQLLGESHYPEFDKVVIAPEIVNEIPAERWPMFLKFHQLLQSRYIKDLGTEQNQEMLTLALSSPVSQPVWEQTIQALSTQATTGKLRMADARGVLGNMIEENVDFKAFRAGGDSRYDDWLKRCFHRFLPSLPAEQPSILPGPGEITERERFRLFKRHGSFEHAKAYSQMLKGEERAFAGFVHQLLFSYPPGSVNGLLHFIEKQFDHPDKNFGVPQLKRGHHPNAAEMLLLLRHPMDAKRDKVAQVVRTITSIDRFIAHDIRDISDPIIKLWSDVGALTHGFRFWAFDAQGGDKSLLAKYGLKPLPQSPAHQKLGRGFLLTGQTKAGNNPLPPNVLAVFWQGGLFISEEGRGSLFIRNSSLVFGRDVTPNVAMWSPQAFGADELKTLDPTTDPSFVNVLSPDLYPDPKDVDFLFGFKSLKEFYRAEAANPELSKDLPVGKMRRLMLDLLAIKEDYRRWKFDTEAFDENDNFIGQLSSGFKPLVAFLKARREEMEKREDERRMFSQLKALGVGIANEPESPKPLPDLAFVHPDYPPSFSYDFVGMDGKAHDRYVLTEENWRVLENYAAGRGMAQDFINTDWFRFLQSGVNNRAELVMLAPESDAPPTPMPIPPLG